MSISIEHAPAPLSLFDGFEPDEAAELLATLETGTFPAGSVVIEEGELPRRLYLVVSGSAAVEVDGRPLARIPRGATIGEMSLITGEPTVATVRALSDLVVRVIGERELDRLGSAHPQIYRNLAAILAARLAKTNKLAIQSEQSSVVEIQAGTPTSAYALACSVAWHTREATAVVLQQAAPELEPFAAPRDSTGSTAHVLVAEAATDLARFLDGLTHRFRHVLLLPREGRPHDVPGTRYTQLHSALEAEQPDHAALREGLLPPTAAGGATYGRVARELMGLTIGLALGAGSLRGYAHAGVIRGMERVGLRADYVSGASIGAAVAGAYAYGYDSDQVADLLDGCARTLFRPTLPVRGFLSSTALGSYLREIFHGARIEDLPTPLGLVAADLLTQREVVLRRGPLWRAALASVSVPGVYPAQRIGPYTLIDGGVVNSVPSGVVTDMGAANVLAVRLLGPNDPIDLNAEATESTGRSPSALATLFGAIEIMQARTSREGGAATVTITPDLPLLRGAKLRNFADGKRFIEAGEAAFEAALPRIASVLPWVRR
jgi:NTE family protein